MVCAQRHTLTTTFYLGGRSLLVEIFVHAGIHYGMRVNKNTTPNQKGFVSCVYGHTKHRYLCMDVIYDVKYITNLNYFLLRFTFTFSWWLHANNMV